MSHFPTNPHDRIQSLSAEVARLTAELAEAHASKQNLDDKYAVVREELAELRAQEPDCFAVLTPNGSKLVSPEEAKGLLRAYPLYARPVPAAQAVPDAMEQYPLRGDEPVGPQAARIDYVRGWNACRDAMLAAAPQPPVSMQKAAS